MVKVPEPALAPAPEPVVELVSLGQLPIDVSVHDLGLRPGLTESLLAAGYETVGDLKSSSDDELLEIDGVGPKSLREVHDVLSRLE